MDERTPLALESGEDGGKGRIAVLAHQQTDLPSVKLDTGLPKCGVR
jgi:hypothetical protein